MKFNLKKISTIIFTLVVAGLFSLGFAKNTRAITECYQAQGSRCISIGLYDSCDESLGQYDSSAKCRENLTSTTCPSGTSSYGSTIKCATSCATSCSGPENKCCAAGGGGGGGGIRAGEEVTKKVIDSLNPLIQQQDDPSKGLAEELSTPGGIISRFLGVFAFPLAGLILFVMLIWGGIEMMAGSATSKSIDAGKQRITSALLGFLLLFASFWIARILEIMFGIKIL